MGWKPRRFGEAPHFVGTPPFWLTPAFCGSPALGAMDCGLRGFSRRGRRSYRGKAPILGKPHIL